jgi:hypothetical protein
MLVRGIAGQTLVGVNLPAAVGVGQDFQFRFTAASRDLSTWQIVPANWGSYSVLPSNVLTDVPIWYSVTFTASVASPFTIRAVKASGATPTLEIWDDVGYLALA